MTRLVYILYGSIHIVMLTLTGSVVFSLGGALILAILCIIYKTPKYIVPTLVIACMSIVIVALYDARQPSIVDQKYYIGTGIVTDYYRTDRYSVDIDNIPYIVQSDQHLKVGDEFFFQAYQQTAYTGGLTRHNTARWQLLSGGYIFDYAKRQYMRGFAATLYSTQSIIIQHTPLSIRQEIRKRVRDRIVGDTPSLNKAIMLGVLLGDRSLLTTQDYQRMIDSGFVHLIAVSGGNIAFLVIIVHLLLFFVPYYLRLAIIACIVLIYAWLCGADSSVLRATIMGLLSIAALFVGRPTYIWRLLGISWVSLLVYNPYFLVYDIGFSLSFAAIVGIVLMQQYIARFDGQHKWVKTLVGYITTTIGASLGVLPFLLFFTYQINILSILANILIAPGVGLLMIASLGQTIAPSRQIRTYPIDTMLYLAEQTAQYGIYMIVDGVRFATLVLIIAIGYGVYSIYKQNSPIRE